MKNFISELSSVAFNNTHSNSTISDSGFSAGVLGHGIPGHRGRILLVDDEPLVLEIIHTALSGEGFEVVCAPSSKAALQQLDRRKFDCLVSDLRLEDHDGFEVLMYARRKSPELAAVLMTGAPCHNDRVRAEELSATYIAKPIGLPQLLELVKDAVRKTQEEFDSALAA